MTDEQEPGQLAGQGPEQSPEQKQMPWFSGFVLQGELAGLYEVEVGREADPQASPAAGAGAGEANPELVLEGLAPITILVGANNSGKSRLLRGIFGDPGFVRSFQFGASLEEARERAHKIAGLISEIPELRQNLHGIMPKKEALNAFPQPIVAQASWISSEAFPILDDLSKALQECDERVPPPRGDQLDFRYEQNAQVIKARKIQDWLNNYSKTRQTYNQPILNAPRYYIPMLRGMRPFAPPSPALVTTTEKKQDAYAQRTEQDYFTTYNWSSGKDDSQGQQACVAFTKRPCIFTGLGIYADMQRRLLSPIHAERDSIRAYEQFLSEQFFPGQPVTLTPALYRFDDQGQRINNDVVYLKIGDSQDRPIYDLGDGMQSLIICTYPIITELNEGSLFFIEEPDLGMHPSLQRIFLAVLRQYHRNKGHQFFLTTHSNHLLDLLEDDPLVSIFSFSKIETAESTAAGQPTTTKPPPTPAQDNNPAVDRFRIRPASQRDRDVLSQLGVRPSATYLANATIWVEGTSDCAYLRAYMEAFIAYLELRGDKAFKAVASQLKRYKEDRHYAFVEYNGANLVHFTFDEAVESASRSTASSGINGASLCAQALVIGDGDIAGKGVRVELYAAQLPERFFVLPVKEIENLIPEEVLRRQVEADSSQKRKVITSQWPKSYEALLYEEYAARSETSGNGKMQGMGAWLNTRSFTGYDAPSGTLNRADKTRWACQDRGIRCLSGKLSARDAAPSTLELYTNLMVTGYETGNRKASSADL
jgi:hypothetical protein